MHDFTFSTNNQTREPVVIKADPGWYRIAYYKNQSVTHCLGEPHAVVAWEIIVTEVVQGNDLSFGRRFTYKVGPIIIGSSSPDYVLQRPDGRYEIEEGVFQTREEITQYLEDLKS